MDITKRAAAIAEVQAKYDDYLMSFPNVIGTGIGYRQIKRQPSEELCLVVMVSRKLAPAKLPSEAMLPDEVENVPIDVIETGAFVI
ncbi:MAG: hypothetical protein OXI30_02395 [Chloroflexota bacterium]|nr:hypothetical protein [Chloroflexota bacterium]